MIWEDIIALYHQLYIVKSISKSFGVLGFRLGILVTSDEAFVSRMKKAVAIWNINSYGEFYMQIYEKYEKDYLASLNRIKKSRRLMIEKLNSLSESHTVSGKLCLLRIAWINK